METKLKDLDIDVPAWIDQDLTDSDIGHIIQGGCASGAYMPAVTYYSARNTMNDYGDKVLDYIEEALGELPAPKPGESWSGLACFYLSIAVELWAQYAEREIELKVEND